MGLDMYLKRGKKIPKRSFKDIKKLEDLLSDNDELIAEEYKDYIFECGEHFHWNSFFQEIVYWRKANQIHQWFVDNVQNGIDDCNYYEVSKEQIEELKELCEEVIEKSVLKEGKIKNGRTYQNNNWEDIIEDGKVIINPEIAQELLPTAEGFFFGSTDYDEYYYEDLVYTIKKLKKVLDTFDFENEYLVYTSSW